MKANKKSEENNSCNFVFITSLRQVDSSFVLSGITNNGRVVISTPKKFRPGDLIEICGEFKDSDGF